MTNNLSNDAAKELCLAYVESFFDGTAIEEEPEERARLITFLTSLGSLTNHPLDLMVMLKAEGWEREQVEEFVMGGLNSSDDIEVGERAFELWDELEI